MAEKEVIKYAVRFDDHAAPLQIRSFKNCILEKEVHLPEKTLDCDVDFSKSDLLDESNFEGAIFKNTAAFNDAVFNKHANFKGAVFKKHANFKGAKFYGEVDFSNAVFEDGASFEGAVFINNGKDVKFDGAWFKPSDRGVIFKGVQFGEKYQITYGDNQIWFSCVEENAWNLKICKKEKGGNSKGTTFTTIHKIEDLKRRLIDFVLGTSDYLKIKNEFNKSIKNPRNVSFKNCIFGELDLINIPTDSIERIIKKLNDRRKLLKDPKRKSNFAAYFQFINNFPKMDTDERLKEYNNSKESINGFLARNLDHETLGSLFTKKASSGVTFEKSIFFNGGSVFFDDAVFLGGFNVSFRGINFYNYGGVSFNNTVFANSVNTSFTGINFLNGDIVSFLNSTFSNSHSVGFDKMIFRNAGSVSFENTLFVNGASVIFTGSSFENRGSVDFINALFMNAGKVSFSSTYSITNFLNTGDVSFKNAEFLKEGDVSFNSANFSNGRQVVFSGAKFSNGGSAIFSGTSFSNDGDVVFHRTSFYVNGDVSFKDAIFSNNKLLKFNNTLFLNGGCVNFSNVSFENKDWISFENTIFANGVDVYFIDSSFGNKEKVIFKQAIWLNGGGLDFTNTEFKDYLRVTFEECLFLNKETIKFIDCITPGIGSFMFQRSHFGDSVREDGSEWIKIDFKDTFFNHTIFEGGEITWLKGKSEKERAIRAILDERNIKPPKKVEEWIEELEGCNKDKTPLITGVFDDDVVVSWKNLSTQSAKSITFHQTNLSRSIFYAMTLSHVELNAPTWKKQYDFDPKNSVLGGSFARKNFGRNILYEEEVVKGRFKNEDPQIDRDYRRQLEGLENQYTQLKTNLEKQGNYHDAGDAHYGEKEMRRLQMDRVTQWISLIYPYRIFVGYGERPLRAFGTLIGAMFGFSFLILLVSSIASGTLFDSNLDCKTIAVNYSRTLISLITPFSWRTAFKTLELHQIPETGLLIFLQIILYIQIPLLVMSVRRRFKR